MSNTRSLIEQFYQEEKERMAAEAAFSPVDIAITSSDMAIANTIAKRFGKDKSVLLREVLSQALIDIFSAIEPAERKMLAKEADELAHSIATEIAEEQGLKEIEVTGTSWIQQDKACVKAERKAEKLKAEKLNTESKTQSADSAATQKAEDSDTESPEMANEPKETQEPVATSDAPFDTSTESDAAKAESKSIFA